jgi:hypothetical protein
MNIWVKCGHHLPLLASETEGLPYLYPNGRCLGDCIECCTSSVQLFILQILLLINQLLHYFTVSLTLMYFGIRW